MSSIPVKRQSCRQIARRPATAALAWVRGNGVALTVLAGLLLIGSLALTQSGLALLAFARFDAAFNQVANTNLPNLLAASRLSELSQSLVARAPELAAAGSQTQRQGIADRLDERLAALAQALDHIDRAAINPGQLQNVRSQRDALATNLRALDDFVRQRIDADNAVATVMARLPALAARVRKVTDEALIAEGDGNFSDEAAARLIERSRLVAWSAAGLEGITLMLGTPAVETRSRLERIRAEFETLVSRMELVRSHLSTPMRQKIDTMHDDIIQFGSGAQGIFQARQAQIEAGTAIQTSLRLIDQNIDKFLASVSTILGATQQEIGSRSANLNQTISHFNLLIIVTSLLCALVGVAIFAYVRRAVITRLKRVQEYMRAQVEGRPAEMSINGADEIAEIATATRVFVTRIANREAALQQRTVELSTALEQQTATAEVLQAINASPGDLTPIFDAVLEKAMRLCDAAFGVFWIVDDDSIRAIPSRTIPLSYSNFLRGQHALPGPESGIAHTLRDRAMLHFPDTAAAKPYLNGDPFAVAAVELGGVRTSLNAPLVKDNVVLGILGIYRQEVRPFSDKQITVLRNFAAQVVIAMDNARLLDEIRQRQAELRVTFDNMGDGVAMFDADLRLAAWNLNFQKILDLPDGFLAGRPRFAEYFEFLAAHGEYASADVEAELRRAGEDTPREMRFERTRPDGRVIEVRRNPVPGGGFVLIYGDVTERKRAEAEIRAARDSAETALRDLQAAQANLVHAQKLAGLGQLTAGIAHEIKSPLNFVNNFAGLSVELLNELKESAAPGIATLDEDTRAEIDDTVVMLTGNLERIVEHGKRADNIVKSMLEHSRGVTGERRAVDLNGLIEEALNLAYHGARAQDQNFNIALERAFDPALVPIELAPQEITRVFLNLFGNGFYAANKHSQEAIAGFRPTLSVGTRDLRDAVEVKVRDNGIGIPPEIRDKLFQPFFTTKPTGEGTGLGLSISYDIVTQQHGGTIAVESEPGAFTEFTVRLPRQ